MEEFKIKGKKAEITTQQLVMIIILIVSFVIILFLLFRLNLGETTDKEICHNSVVLASKSSGIAQSLDCRTNYLCISGGDNCEGISPTATVEVDATNKNETLRAIADEMADCWWQFGEGKLTYLRTDVGRAYHCAVCSIVKFDSPIQDNDAEVTYKELYEYLRDTKMDDTETYLSYLYGVSDLQEVQELNKGLDINSEKILTDERYAIVTGLDPNAVFADRFVNPYIVKPDEITSKTACGVFDVTKA